MIGEWLSLKRVYMYFYAFLLQSPMSTTFIRKLYIENCISCLNILLLLVTHPPQILLIVVLSWLRETLFLSIWTLTQIPRPSSGPVTVSPSLRPLGGQWGPTSLTLGGLLVGVRRVPTLCRVPAMQALSTLLFNLKLYVRSKIHQL